MKLTMWSLAAAALLVGGTVGCSSTTTTPNPVGSAGGANAEDGPVPVFSLTDVNDTSPTTGQPVSPRDYIGQVSAWYFAHAT